MKEKTTVFDYVKIIDATFEALKSFEGNASISQIKDKVIEILNISEQDQNHLLGNGSNELDLKLSFSRIMLKNEGIIANPIRGFWTLLGEYRNVEKIDADEVFRRRINSSKKGKGKKDKENTDIVDLDETLIEEEIHDDEISEIEIKNLLLKRVKEIPARAFEVLCVRLLNSLGFELSTTQYVHDGGLDATGFVMVNGVLRFEVAIQCKRYNENNNIGHNEIDAFVNSATRNGFHRGIFITTSNFTKDAKDAARASNIANNRFVDLIDGVELSNLLFINKMGYKKIEKTSYFPEEHIETSYEIDEDFFNDISKE